MHDYGISEELVGALDRYVHQRIAPGHFLLAVLANDLRAACARADHVNRHALFGIVLYINNELPAACWGSKECVQAWLARDGQGQESAR